MAVINSLAESITSSYNEFLELLPVNFRIFPSLFFIAIVIAFYGIFIWIFHRFLARKDVLKLDLKKYNVYQHSGILKFFRTIFYIFQFVIISPIAIFLWFAVLSVFIIILANDIEVGTVIFLCAALISGIRITAYFKEDLSRDLAKLIPLTLLAVSITSPDSLNIGLNLGRIAQIPLFFQNAFYYLLFIISLEIVLRIFYIPVLMLESKKDKKAREDKEKEE